MDNKQLELEVKSVAEDGTFEGWAAVYGNVDSQGDRIQPGSFAADEGKEIPILWSHKRDEVVGVGQLENTPDGVRLKGRLLLDTQAGREAYSRLKAGAARGLSVGFQLLKHFLDGAVRVITSGAIREVSLVAFPANPEAVVTSVKAEAGENPYRVLRRTLRPDWNLWRVDK